MSPVLLTGARFALAGIILLAIAAARGDAFPRSRRLIAELITVGVLLVCIGNFAVAWAEQWVPSGLAALFVATAPFWVTMIERMRLGGERIDLRRGIGMLLGFAGVALLVMPGGKAGPPDIHFVLGALGIQAGCIAWQYGTVRAKYNLARIPPLMSSGMQMLSGGSILMVIGLATGEGRHFVMTHDSVMALFY